MQKEENKKASKTFPIAIALAIVIVAAVAIAGFFYFSKTPFAVLSAQNTLPESTLPAGEAVGATTSYEEQPFYYYPGSPIADPTRYPVREKYFKEAFQINREAYDLFEKASKKLNIPLEQTPQYFTLNSEQDIWGSLPRPPNDFGETGYLIATGRNYAIGSLDESYYLQPEFYPGFKNNGLRFWSDPDPRYWAANGFGTYPADQWDSLQIGEREEFTAVVFMYSGFGVQTYQGVKLAPTAASQENFDISVTPDVFLLEPTFPKFEEGWVQRVVVMGKLKPGTKPGNYVVGLNVEVPPVEKLQEWQFKYRSLYYNAATAIAPSGNAITLYITVS